MKRTIRLFFNTSKDPRGHRNRAGNNSLLLLLMAVFINTAQSVAQPSITGPACVLAGVTYSYEVKMDYSDVSNASFCITGGAFANESNSCITGKAISRIDIIWQSGKQGRLTLTARDGTANLNVTITAPLDGGTVSITTPQTARLGSIPTTVFSCSAARGGGCNPVYEYQWQTSQDMLTWQDLSGATGSSLKFTKKLDGSAFYRRRVLEKTSNTIAYSTVLTLFTDAGQNP
jgi:hypothetical protein